MSSKIELEVIPKAKMVKKQQITTQTPDRINVQRFTQKLFSQEGGGNVQKMENKRTTKKIS